MHFVGVNIDVYTNSYVSVTRTLLKKSPPVLDRLDYRKEIRSTILNL